MLDESGARVDCREVGRVSAHTYEKGEGHGGATPQLSSGFSRAGSSRRAQSGDRNLGPARAHGPRRRPPGEPHRPPNPRTVARVCPSDEVPDGLAATALEWLLHGLSASVLHCHWLRGDSAARQPRASAALLPRC